MVFRRCLSSGPLIPGSALTDMKQTLKAAKLGGSLCIVDAEEPQASFEKVVAEDTDHTIPVDASSGWNAPVNDISRSQW